MAAAPRRPRAPRGILAHPFKLHVALLDADDPQLAGVDAPPDARWRVLHGHTKGSDFEYEGVGIVVEDVGQGGFFGFWLGDEVVQLWHQAVYHRKSALFVQRTWRPGLPIANTDHGLARPTGWKQHQLEQRILREAWLLLDAVAHQGGAPPHTGEHKVWAWPEVERIWRRTVAREHGQGKRPGYGALADDLGCSRPTFYKHYLPAELGAARKARLDEIAEQVKRAALKEAQKLSRQRF